MSKLVSMLSSNELEICEMQINRLRKSAEERLLTLEETKQLEILVKTLYLSKGQPTDITAEYKKVEALSTDALIEIAETTIDAEVYKEPKKD